MSKDQNKDPRVGGGDQNRSPRSGAKSAPTAGPDVRSGIAPRNPRGSKSGPTEAPGVRAGVTIPTNGDPYTPTSMKMDEKVDPTQPPKGANR